MSTSASGNENRLSPWPGRKPDKKAGQGGGPGRVDPRATRSSSFDRSGPRADQTPDHRPAPLVENGEKGHYQTTVPLSNQAETENRRRRFALAASEAHDHGSTNMGGLSCL
jgi:hypothetical protein